MQQGGEIHHGGRVRGGFREGWGYTSAYDTVSYNAMQFIIIIKKIHSLGQRTIVKVELRTITLREFWAVWNVWIVKWLDFRVQGKRYWKCYWASACSSLSLIVSEDTEFALMVVKQSLLL